MPRRDGARNGRVQRVLITVAAIATIVIAIGTIVGWVIADALAFVTLVDAEGERVDDLPWEIIVPGLPPISANADGFWPVPVDAANKPVIIRLKGETRFQIELVLPVLKRGQYRAIQLPWKRQSFLARSDV